jgi:hypothetical protein
MSTNEQLDLTPGTASKHCYAPVSSSRVGAAGGRLGMTKGARDDGRSGMTGARVDAGRDYRAQNRCVYVSFVAPLRLSVRTSASELSQLCR